MEEPRQKQQRPSVLCHVFQTASRQQPAGAVCKREADVDQLSPSASPRKSSSSSRTSHQIVPVKIDESKQSSSDSRLHDGFLQGTSSLFVNGVCRWPGCDVVSEDFASFLKHLHSDHGHGDRSIAQWRVQQDIVQCMENQLLQEKQKLIAMQLHLSELQSSRTPPDADGEHHWASIHLEEMNLHGYRAAGSAYVLPDLVSSSDCYKFHNIRPPYTYAHLIRWSILESPVKQRTLSEIYGWFSSKFFYFRHNTATWKNAVRHNLSLHKCFVRVEGGKGAVWTVDEREYQKRRSQKYHRDCPVKWFSPYSLYCDEEPSPSAAGLSASRGWS